MSWARVAAARLRGMFRRARAERELEEEVRFHLDMQAEDNLRSGMDPEDARRAARRGFGGVEPMKERHREGRTFAALDDLARDARYALRALGRSPAFTAASVATLALAIGANTAMFSVIDAVLLRPLPYESPDRLALLWTEIPSRGLREGRPTSADVEQWRAAARSFEDIAISDGASVTLTGPAGAERISAVRASPNLFPMLGVRPALGRVFSREEADRQQRVALIGHRFWQTRFGASREALGATLEIDGRPSRIVGVLPAGFDPWGNGADVWEPHTMAPGGRQAAIWMALGRLRPGVSIERAQAEMSAIALRLDEQAPADRRGRGISVVPLSLHVTGSRQRAALWMLAGAVLCMLLIAAANVAGLSLARAVARTREMAVRAALGAAAGRLARQLLAESLVLAALAGALGALLALAAIDLIRAFGPAGLARLNEIRLDPRALGWALGLSLLTGALVGLAPALTMRRGSLKPSPAGNRIRRVLVVAEFAMAIVLLAGAGLLIRSWLLVGSVDPGFRPERVLTLQISTTAFPGPERRLAFYDRLVEQVAALPGVESAGIGSEFFIGGAVERAVETETEMRRVRFRSDEATAGFFTAAGARLLRGRWFSTSDRPDTPRVAIVTQAMARALWPDGEAVGRRFRPGGSGPWFHVVGVIADMRRQGLETEAPPQMFEALAQNPPRLATLLVRTAGDPAAMAPEVEAAIRAVDQAAPVYGAATLESRLGAQLAQRRFQTWLLAGFSAVALLMAAIGIYGLIQYSIAARTREIGIRIAVGARPVEIFRMVLGEGMKLSLAGLAIGLAGALWLGRAASGLLFGVTATDPLTFASVSLLLAAVAAVACVLPARRAMKVEPVRALRQE